MKVKNFNKVFKKSKNLIILFFILTAGLFAVHFVLAQSADELAFGGTQNEVGNAIGLGDEDPRIMVARVINVFLGFLGIIAVILIMYAGWLWMTSEGNEEKVASAKKILQNALIGLVIILISFGIVTFILNKLIGSSGPGFNINSDGAVQGGGLPSLGSGIIESHYPGRNQKDVARNTKIVITFKEEMDLSTMIEDTNGDGTYGGWTTDDGDGVMEEGEYDKIKADNILIYKTADEIDGPFAADLFIATNDKKTFVLKQVSSYIGSPSEYIWYSAVLTSNIKKANGNKAFPGVIGDIGYDWSFEVGTTIDLTPPKIESVYPYSNTEEARNVVIQINFDEAIDPMSASGQTSNFSNIEIKDITGGASGIVDGIFYISNQYKTVEFLTEEACGINSCGNTIYCLPGDADLSPLVKAASLAVAGQPTAIFSNEGYDGVVDMADNSFDGNRDGLAQGPGLPPLGDDYEWPFSTNNEIDINPPVITAISPNIKEDSVSLNTVPEATFNKILMSKSVNTNSVTLAPSTGAINYWTGKADADGKTAVKINHDVFLEDANYSPWLNSGIMDIYQNCYSACSGVDKDGNPVTGALSCCNGVATNEPTCQ